jgi:asparagine synthase (glutamine-hydrolysing)
MAHLEEGLGGQAARFARFGAPEGGSANMMQRLDRFYLQQRVRHFIGNGLALYGETTAWRTPFLSIPWVAAATRLPRSWKLGSNWHRHAIDRLCPALLDFPEERVADHMARRAPMLYWHRRRRQQPVVPYVDYRRLLSQPDILALLADHASAIDDVLPVASQRQLIDAIRNGQRGHRLFSILTSLAIWRWNAKQA